MKSDLKNQRIIDDFIEHVQSKGFPCIAANDAASKNTIKFFVADHMACPKDNSEILHFIYDFVDQYRAADHGFHSIAIIFKEPTISDEESFDFFVWERLQSLSDLDSKFYMYDPRVEQDVTSPHFSYSLKEEAFYIIGLHPASSRLARKFKYPTLVFNPHSQFEKLRELNQYSKMQHVVRNRDIIYSGSVNPMLADFGKSSEVFQYTGRAYPEGWKCPLNLKHASKHNSTT